MPDVDLKIISGGQTGIDRVALDAAMEMGISHGGWCPKGRLAEDGKIPQRYQLTETNSRNYSVRTEQNVKDSDGTLVIYVSSLSGGTALTARLAKKHGKPCYKLDFGLLDETDFETEVRAVVTWIHQHRISILNVAGPRNSTSPELSAQVHPFLISVFQAG